MNVSIDKFQGNMLSIRFEEEDNMTLTVLAAAKSSYMHPGISIHHLTLDQVKQLRDACSLFIEAEEAQEVKA